MYNIRQYIKQTYRIQFSHADSSQARFLKFLEFFYAVAKECEVCAWEFFPRAPRRFLKFLLQEFQESRKNSESSTTTTEEEFQESPSGSCALTTTEEEEFQESEVEKNPSVAAGVGALSGNLEILGILPGSKLGEG